MAICENCIHSYIKQEGSSAYTSCKRGCLFDDGTFPKSCSGFEEKQNCTECENETMLKYSSLYCDYEDLKEKVGILQDLLNASNKFNDFLSRKNEELENKLRLYKEKCEGEE